VIDGYNIVINGYNISFTYICVAYDHRLCIVNFIGFTYICGRGS